MPTEESKAVSKHERKPESLTLKEKYLYFRVALRIIVIVCIYFTLLTLSF